MNKLSKIFALIMTMVVIVSTFAFGATVSAEGAEATAVYGTPQKIDGKLDDGWKNANTYTADKTMENPSDISLSWKTMYDGTNLYFFAEVTDATIGTAEQEKAWYDSYWQKNTLQVYLDFGNEKTAGGYDENDFRFDINARGYFYAHWIHAVSFVDYEVVVTETGYTVECAVDLGFYPEFKAQEGTKFGFDIWACDSNGDFGWRAGAKSWTGQGNVYCDASLMGTVTLGAKPASAAGYNGIVKGNTLQTLGATLTGISNATGDHMNNIANMVDGKRNEGQSIDTWGCTYTDDLGVWFGAEFEKEYDVAQVIFWEGGHWDDGGWFGSSPKVQCFVDGAWVDVDFEISPEYPADNRDAQGAYGETYLLTLDKAVTCSKVRIVGNKTSLGGQHASIIELQVNGYAAGQAPTEDVPQSPSTSDMAVAVAALAVVSLAAIVVSKKRR